MMIKLAGTLERDYLRTTPPPSETVPTTGLFEGLPEESIKMMLERASRNDYSPGHWFYMQGQPPRDFYFLESGLVRLSHSTSSGEDVLARFIAPGEVFGYFALVLGTVNVASARVVQPSRVIVWDRATALQLLQEIPRAAANLLAIAVRDVAYFYERTQRLMREGVAKRVQWALSELARTVGEKKGRWHCD